MALTPPGILCLGFLEEVVPEESAGGSCPEGQVVSLLRAGVALPLLCRVSQGPRLPGSLASHLPGGSDQWEALPETGDRRGRSQVCLPVSVGFSLGLHGCMSTGLLLPAAGPAVTPPSAGRSQLLGLCCPSTPPSNCRCRVKEAIHKRTPTL